MTMKDVFEQTTAEQVHDARREEILENIRQAERLARRAAARAKRIQETMKRMAQPFNGIKGLNKVQA